MSNLKPNLLSILISCGLGAAGAPACTAAAPEATGQVNDAATNQSAQQPGSVEVVREAPRGRRGDMKVLAEGSYGQVSDPFVAVARDARVYAALRRMAKELPPLADDFFRSNAVVAAFAGLRNTGGYSIEVTRTDRGQLLVIQHAPAPDMMTTQVLTHPFQVVAVPAKEGENVSLVLQGGLAMSMLRPYRVASGGLASGEGRAGGAEKVGLEGELRVARYEELATVFFDVRGAGAKGSNVLQAAATGVVGDGGRFSLTGLGAGTLAGEASPRLRVTGRLTGRDEDRLELDFASPLPSVAGGAGGAGKLSAVATGPAPARSQPGASMY